MSIELSSEDAWRNHILPSLARSRWMEESADVSSSLPLSKRELVGLVLLRALGSHQTGTPWCVGYSPEDSEPNDGYVATPIGDPAQYTSKISAEHKLVPQMSKQAALEGILSTYEKYAKKGEAYGSNRTLLIYANKQTKGLIKVSELRDEIRANDSCPFDQVLLMWLAKPEATRFVFHVMSAFPHLGLSEVRITHASGTAVVATRSFDLIGAPSEATGRGG